MAKVQNTFLKSKMNKDLDARILPEGEYRDARNAQISKSESSQVGNLENTLGNHSIQNYQTLTQSTNIKCIGHFSDEINSTVYLFFTDYIDSFPNRFIYNPQAKNFIISTNVLTNQSNILVQGAFLNFSQTNIITGVNILEDLLFFTDDRNQPRVINTLLANPDPTNIFPTYYSTEDQISVAKYNPYSCMEMFQKSTLDPGSYETTMKDVSSKFLPNGGQATTTSNQTGATINVALSIIGQVNTATSPWGSANVSLFDSFDNTLIPTGATVNSITLDTSTSPNSYNIALDTSITTTSTRNTLVFEPNPYFNGAFGGDADYLESIFPRFSYRFKFTDNTYSIFAPFTQIAFIPKQDGYFMFAENPDQEKDDQNEAYRSTIVYFVENKVNNIGLRIPLPFNNYTLSNALKIEEIDILYKESDGIAVRVVETVPIGRVQSQSGVCLTNGAQTPGASGNNIAIDSLQGGITIGDPITGPGINDGTTILSFTPTDPSNAVSGNITVSSTVPQLDDNVLLTIGSPNFFVYDYTSTKPTKTLPESNLVRVFDKIPVRAKAQEVTGNRVIYGNFLNKIDPPAFLNYNVASTVKPEFAINEITAAYAGAAATYTAFVDTIAINVSKSDSPWYVGYTITSNTYGVIIPPGTQIASTDSNTTGAANITLTETVTFPAGTPINVVLIMEPGADTENSESIIEYPNHSVKTNRNYQIGFVLSDRYGRQSSVILSNNETKIKVAGVEYSGSTLFSPYIDESVNTTSWPGNSLKVLMNEPINENLYNGDVTSADYNPLGWYSYKIVVKQTEQEYYNVYLPGIMASYPEDRTLEIGQTSHIVLINDNINKIPRDLTEVGPDQKQFRSSVQLFGRVQNITTATTPISGNTNTQYYPGTNSDTVSIISTVNDLFDYNPINPNQPNYFPQFYSLDSNPLVARISTEAQIGQIATTGQTYNYIPAAGTIVNPPNTDDGTGNPVVPLVPTNQILITNVASQTPITLNSLVNYLVTGQGVPEGTYVSGNNAAAADGSVNNITLVNSANVSVFVNLTDGIEVVFTPASATTDLLTPGIQYLAVYETEAVKSAIDIFWESSSTGLIGDLNAAILNNQDQPAGSNISWNPSEFNEGLAAQGSILNGNGFNIVDNFGQTITIDPSTDTVEFGAPNNLPAITDGYGNDCNGSPSTSTTEVRDYFRLVPQSSTGPWQVRTTSQTDGLAESVNYFDNIFYMYDDNEALRQFNFNFKITVGGQVNYITNVQANLQNVAPEYYKITAKNTVNAGDVTYGPGGTLPLQEFIPVRTRKNDGDIAIINFSNGSANKNDSLSSGALSVKDLQIINSFGDNFSVYDQRIGSPNGQPAEVLFMGDTEPIFAIQEESSSSEAGTLQVKLINQFANNEQANVPAALYFVTVLIQDGQTTVEQKFEIDMRLELNNNNFLNKFQRSKDFGAADIQGQFSAVPTPDSITKYGQCGTNDFYIYGESSKDWKSHNMTLINIPSTTPGIGNDEIGYYIYAAGFFKNHNPVLSQGCTEEYSPSVDLVTYAQNANEVFNNTITIPFNTPNIWGHKVQKQKSFVTSENWQLPPYCHGKGKVVGTNINVDGITYNYEIEPVGSETTQNDISACMLFFKNSWNNGTADAGEHVRQGRKANTINTGDASNRIAAAVNLNNGNVAIKFSPNTYDNISLQLNDHIYTYGGGFNETTSPWFFSPGIDSDSVMKVWAMWIYSEWLPPYWENSDRNFSRWSPAWEPYTSANTTGEPVPNFPLVIAAFSQEDWMSQVNSSSTQEQCASAPIYVNQNYEVTEANNYLYSIQ
jgi:hypothetical protein